MDTTNRPESNLPARISPVGSRLQASIPPSQFGGPAGGPSAPSGSVGLRTLLRGLSRHWWHILGLTLICSLPLVYGIYSFMQPMYEAQGLLRIEAAKPSLYASSSGTGERGFGDTFLRTQLQLIVGQRVLEKVATNPLTSQLPLIKNSKDYYLDLSKSLTVQNPKDTFLIRVALESKDPDEAYEIVKGVIFAYMQEARIYGQADNNVLVKGYKGELDKLKKEIDEQTKILVELTKKGNIVANSDRNAPPTAAGEEPAKDATEKVFQADTVTENQYAQFKSDYVKKSIELEAAEAILKKRLEESDPAKEATAQEEEHVIADAELKQLIELEFRADPDVKSLVNSIEDKEKEWDRVAAIARDKKREPALNWIQKEIVALSKQYDKLWDEKYDAIKKRVLSDNPGMPGATTDTLKEVQQKVVTLRADKETLKKYLDGLGIENKEARVDALNADIAREKRRMLNNRMIQVENHLRQAEFEAGSDAVRVLIADDVVKPKTPSQNKRIKFMVMAPIGILCGFLGLFLLLEIKAERVSDPEALSTRVQSEVFALPPLPSAREVRKMRELENGSDQIDRFIQRLDHLRFAVCGSQTALDTGRCVLITSAVGGEGKTTLAAQLAARCGNAGMSTLLIDADLRRASLGTLLDIPEGPGLSDVLKGDISAEEAAIPVQGGTFHLLLAGTPIEDVSRLLHGDNFGALIARLRELYDLIVIDSPPVLPVPDALILGQWADGAILASRFDISRFPQIERARKQLDNAGISVLGTVINGMRSPDSYYGHYSYNRKRNSLPNSSNAT